MWLCSNFQGENFVGPTPILVAFWGVFQQFRRSSPSYLFGSSPGSSCCCTDQYISLSVLFKYDDWGKPDSLSIYFHVVLRDLYLPLNLLFKYNSWIKSDSLFIYLHVVSQINSPHVFFWAMIPIVLLAIPKPVVRVKSPVWGSVFLFEKPKMPLERK